MIEVKNLNLSIKDEKILENISFKSSSNLAVMGHSGAGKSTLFKLLSGIYPSDYELSYDKLIINEAPKYIFQDCISCFHPYFKLGSQFTMVLPKCKCEALEMFERLGVPKKVWNSYPHELSLGMARRVQIALNLLMKNKESILICDEITSSLDEQNTTKIVEILRNLKMQKVIITHDELIAKKLCLDLLVLDGGKVKYFGGFDGFRS